MTDVPPPRYRIVERGRRLEVIDTQGGATITRPAIDPAARRAGPAAPRLPRPRRTGFDGRAELTTHRIYDDKGPRTLQLDPGSSAAIARVKLAALISAFALIVLAVWQPWVLALPLVVAADGVRTPLRTAITRWLDTVERENG